MRRILVAALLCLVAASAQAQSLGAASITYSPAGVAADIPPGNTVGISAAPYTSRTYDAVVVVSTTIAAAIASISDNTYAKRYLVYVPNGTYTEGNLQMKNYVDVVGESRDGVILTDGSANDTIKIGGINAMLANMTIRHTTGDAYPIHADTGTAAASGFTPTSGATTILYRLTVTAAGTAKSGVGIGLYNYQRLYIIDSSFTATSAATMAGVYAHGAAGVAQSAPIYLLLYNVTATSTVGPGFKWDNAGSSKPDLVSILGGSYSGMGGVGGEDIVTANTGAGAGEAYLSLDDQVLYSTSSHVDATHVVTLPAAIASIPTPSQPTYREFLGGMAVAPSIFTVDSTGTLFATTTMFKPPAASPATSTVLTPRNSGEVFQIGVEGSTGGTIFSGSAVYSAVVGTVLTHPLELYTNSVRRVSVGGTTGEASFTNGEGFPMVADAVVQVGQTVMPDAGTDGRFDLNTGSGTLGIGVLGGTAVAAQGTSYPVISNGLAYVAVTEDTAVTRGHHLLQSATAGYCSDSATVSTDGLNIARTLRSEPVTNVIVFNGCTGGAGCINTALNTPNVGAAGMITLSADVAAAGWAVGEPVVYWNSGGTTPTGLTDGKTYFLLSVATTNVTLSATKGGTVVVPSSQGDDSTQYLQRLPLSVIAIQ